MLRNTVTDEQLCLSTCFLVFACQNNRPVYSCISPPPGRGGIKSKDLKIGKEIKGWKNEKMKNIEDFTLLTVLKCNI